MRTISTLIAVLKTGSSVYEWSIPVNKNNESHPFVYGHSAAIYKGRMYISFGSNLAGFKNPDATFIFDTTDFFPQGSVSEIAKKSNLKSIFGIFYIAAAMMFIMFKLSKKKI